MSPCIPICTMRRLFSISFNEIGSRKTFSRSFNHIIKALQTCCLEPNQYFLNSSPMFVYVLFCRIIASQEHHSIDSFIANNLNNRIKEKTKGRIHLKPLFYAPIIPLISNLMLILLKRSNKSNLMFYNFLFIFANFEICCETQKKTDDSDIELVYYVFEEKEKRSYGIYVCISYILYKKRFQFPLF